MKKWLALLLAALFSCLVMGALADGDAEVPQEVESFLAQSSWSSGTVTGWVNPAGLQTSGACAFAVVKTESTNDLLAFGWKDGAWKYLWHNANALPKGQVIELGDYSSASPTFVSYYVVDGEIMEMACWWKKDSVGAWKLVHMEHMGNYWDMGLMFYDTSVAGKLRIYNTGWTEKDSDTWITGVYETDLRYFSLAGFPKTVKEAQSKLSMPPEIPQGTLSASNVSFSKGKTYKVYAGPGEEYGQSGKGKAVVSTNDWVQVFGQDNGWLMVQYDITSDHMRIGWIHTDAPKGADIPELTFSDVKALLTMDALLTDDPLFSQTAVTTLPAGAELVWLADLGDWAYVETVGTTLVRGFVSLQQLQTDRIFHLENYNGIGSSVQGTLHLTYDGKISLYATTTQVDSVKLYGSDAAPLASVPAIDGTLSLDNVSYPLGMENITLVMTDKTGKELPNVVLQVSML